MTTSLTILLILGLIQDWLVIIIAFVFYHFLIFNFINIFIIINVKSTIIIMISNFLLRNYYI
jgi:hypothetical protein